MRAEETELTTCWWPLNFLMRSAVATSNAAADLSALAEKMVLRRVRHADAHTLTHTLLTNKHPHHSKACEIKDRMGCCCMTAMPHIPRTHIQTKNEIDEEPYVPSEDHWTSSTAFEWPLSTAVFLHSPNVSHKTCEAS